MIDPPPPPPRTGPSKPTRAARRRPGRGAQPDAKTHTHLHHRSHATNTAKQSTAAPVARGPCWPQPLPLDGPPAADPAGSDRAFTREPPEADVPITTLDRCPSSHRAATKPPGEAAPPPDGATAPARARRRTAEPRHSSAPPTASRPAPARGSAQREKERPRRRLRRRL